MTLSLTPSARTVSLLVSVAKEWPRCVFSGNRECSETHTHTHTHTSVSNNTHSCIEQQMLETRWCFCISCTQKGQISKRFFVNSETRRKSVS